MDWLAKYHTVIVCDEKVVRILYENEVRIIQGAGSDGGNKSRLSIISCTKTQKYIQKSHGAFEYIKHHPEMQELSTQLIRTCDKGFLSLVPNHGEDPVFVCQEERLIFSDVVIDYRELTNLCEERYPASRNR
ncbi:hypothetical protein Tco_0946820 [Tanacetum coccineum]